MNKGLKIAIISGTVILVGGLVYFVGIRPSIKKKKALNDNTSYPTGDNTVSTKIDTTSGGATSGSTTTTSDVAREFTVGYVSERPTESINFVPHFDPRPEANSITKGNMVRITRMDKYNGTYSVSGTWIDTNGNLGALYLSSPNVTTANTTNRTWQGKAKIQLLK